MAKPASKDLREAIVRNMQAGKDKKEIAKWLFVCVRTVTRIWKKFVAVGSIEPEAQNSGRKPLVSDEAMSSVVAKIREVPDITLRELIDELNLPISESALCRRVNKLGLRLKKNAPSERTKT